jgi:ketosteroid isomerase-like protein
MKKPGKDSTMKLSVFSRTAIILFVSLVLTTAANPQSKPASSASQGLYDRIASLDSSFFEAYNRCELAKIEAYFTDDVEFYHEKRGVIKTRKGVMEVIAKNLCGDSSNKVRRELVAGSLHVYAINDYGAIAIGEHRFYLTQKGQIEKLDGTGKFVNLWQRQDGAWRMSSVLSYGFRPGMRGATLSEPEADRGPQAGSPLGVVDATGQALDCAPAMLLKESP